MARLSVRPGISRRKAARSTVKHDIGSAGELFKGLGSFLEGIAEMEEKGEEKTEGTGEINLPGGKAVYGFSVKIGGAGIPRLEHFGNIVRETRKGPIVEEIREAIVDIHEEKDRIEVIAELPGVEMKDISYEIKNNVLILNAGNNGRKYRKEVLLPSKVSVLTTSYNNGIYRLSLKKEKDGE